MMTMWLGIFREISRAAQELAEEILGKETPAMPKQERTERLKRSLICSERRFNPMAASRCPADPSDTYIGMGRDCPAGVIAEPQSMGDSWPETEAAYTNREFALTVSKQTPRRNKNIKMKRRIVLFFCFITGSN